MKVTYLAALLFFLLGLIGIVYGGYNIIRLYTSELHVLASYYVLEYGKLSIVFGLIFLAIGTALYLFARRQKRKK